MNNSPKRVMLQRIIFVLVAMVIVAAFCAGSCSEKRNDPDRMNAEQALTQGASPSASDTVSDADTDAVGDVVSDTKPEPPVERSLTDEELKAFWDSSVFVGDSVTLGLRNYVTKQRNNGVECLGEAQFLAVGNMSYTNTLPEIGAKDAYHPKFQGKTVTVDEGVKLCGAKHVFILLGMNDFAAYSTETCLESAKELVARIKEKSPDVDIYIESVTPTLHNHKVFNNDNIDLYNEQMEKLCGEQGWTFVNVASVMKDEDGLFKSEYCSDPEKEGVHMEAEGCEAWIDYLNIFITNGGSTK